MKHIFNAAVQSKAIWVMVCQVVLELIIVAADAKILILIAKVAEEPVTENLTAVLWWCILQGIFSAIKRYLGWSAHLLFTNLNDRIADKVLDMDVSDYLEIGAGRIATITESLWPLTKMIQQAMDMVMSFMLVIVNVYMILSISSAQIIPLICVSSVLVILLLSLDVYWHKVDDLAQEIKRDRNIELDEVVNGFMEVRSFGGTLESHRENIHSANSRMMGIIRKRMLSGMIMDMCINGGATLLTMLALSWCCMALKDGIIGSAMVVTLIMYYWKLCGPFCNLVFGWSDMSEMRAKLPEFNMLMNIQPKINDGALIMDQFNDSIEFNNVSFSYDKLSSVLEGINFKIKKGQKIGICGSSGGGKSTLLRLLLRFYDVKTGSIKIDGVDIKNYNRVSMKKFIGIVHQSTHIFNGTIRDNIAYALKPNKVSDETIIEACKNAGLWEFVQSLDKGLDTKVGNRGLRLSGGQQQRINLARLFLADPEIIILDEATSGLDNMTEKVVQQALSMFKHKTIIAVAHRLTTIQDSDIIYVLAGHKINEFGTHEELMKMNGEYAKMVKATESN